MFWSFLWVEHMGVSTCENALVPSALSNDASIFTRKAAEDRTVCIIHPRICLDRNNSRNGQDLPTGGPRGLGQQPEGTTQTPSIPPEF